ncbi:MAG: diaminopimelate decarboxylase [Chloroflexi bacterium]|nr:diaminopimelate decarboxylase [Chloroflexota bacterium]
MTFPKAPLFPVTAGVNAQGHLVLGGCDVVDLASEFGTPLYVFDEATLRDKCREFVREFTSLYPNTGVIYASKAFLNPALAKLIREEGLGLDVVSGGELAVALAVEFPMEEIYFHGNNKSLQELEMALDNRVGRVVADNISELNMLNDLAGKAGLIQNIMLRISPGVDPHTHAHTTTGVLDSKFGFPIETGQAEEGLIHALSLPNLNLVGLHFHLGSPIFELEPYAIAIDVVLAFAARFKERFQLKEISPGGGFAIGYVMDKPPPPVKAYAQTIVSALTSRCRSLGLDEPRLVIEPGRAIVGQAGVALYTVGAIKEIPGLRKYVSLDGGMGDNIRPALYGAIYEAVKASEMRKQPKERVTLAGKFCESGDILIKDADMPILEPGDIVAIPSSGAYSPSMASNYNLAPRPVIVMVKDGEARLIRRRESFQDLMHCDVY